MSAIWHDSPYPSLLAPAPMFSFQDVAEIVAPAPEAYAKAYWRMQQWERMMGAAWFRHNAELAHAFWDRKRPWWS